MKPVLLKIASVLMAAIVTFSTLSFAIDMHYCGDFLVDASLFSEAESCDSDSMFDMGSSCSLTDNNCCSDEVLVIEGQDELTIQLLNKNLDSENKTLFSKVNYGLNCCNLSAKKVLINEVYAPPQVVDDFQIVHQVFLI